jgi:hypothetical protein
MEDGGALFPALAYIDPMITDTDAAAAYIQTLKQKPFESAEFVVSHSHAQSTPIGLISLSLAAVFAQSYEVSLYLMPAAQRTGFGRTLAGFTRILADFSTRYMDDNLHFVEALVRSTHRLCQNLCIKAGFKSVEGLCAMHPHTQEVYKAFYYPLFANRQAPTFLHATQQGGLDQLTLTRSLTM